MTLPKAFYDDLSHYVTAAELDELTDAIANTEPSVSIRINESKLPLCSLSESGIIPDNTSEVPWCMEGRYLESRPQFTLDPLLHSGSYYVQEASSMFITHVLRTFVSKPVTALDLCAAPGGKSTAAISALPEGSILVSNEIDRRRARILAENIQKWGSPNVCVTANAPADFRKLSNTFDVIIADVPCSGEGMFRKDPDTISEWSPSKVRECAALQKSILSDIWPTLRPGGLLVYSTCTFNVHEDEEQLQFICQELGAELLTIPVEKAWNIHPAICGDFAPVVQPESACRFMPHFTKGEGLFMAALRKNGYSADGGSSHKPLPAARNAKELQHLNEWVSTPCSITMTPDGMIRAIPDSLRNIYNALISNRLFILHAGIEIGTQKGRDIIPAHALSLSTALDRNVFPEAELELQDALNYLRRESVVLPPSLPKGFVVLTFRHQPIGFVKNLGNRCNSLYPTEWRIRNL